MVFLKNFFKTKLLFLILVFTFLSRSYLIWYPAGYIFDEVYHGFTAKEYLKGSKEAWEWWNSPPEGVAYEWTHPPLAKEIMASSMKIFNSTNSWAYRIPGVIFGVISVYLIFKIARKLFNKDSIALLSAFIFSIDGLNFVQSRTGMNDIYFVAFMLASFYLLLSKKYFFSSILFGLSLSSKWAAIYFLAMIVLILFFDKRLKKIVYFLIIPIFIYLATYLPFFLQGHSFEQFINLKGIYNCTLDPKKQDNCSWNFGLQEQMWYYHTHLKANHDYTSAWWSWPLNLYPVWYFVDYHEGKISNIFASGNPAVFWMGSITVILTLLTLLKKFFKSLGKINLHQLIFQHSNIVNPQTKAYLICLWGFLIFWLPWSISPRIMFLYHYSPSVPFIAILLGHQLSTLFQEKSQKKWAVVILVYLILGFLFVYPMLVGIALPKELMQLFFRTNLTKNPFGS